MFRETCLPPELLLPILGFIHPFDFDYTFCLVSRTFRYNVECQFYKYVAVPEKRLLFFCRTMFARPDLARCVRRLAFTGAVHREPEPGDTDEVARMMKLLVNLKDLSITASIYMPKTGEREWPVGRDDVRILHDCQFKLERLYSMFTWGEPLARWLATQPQLASFEHDGYPRGQVRLAPADATLLRCAYLRITPYILECFEGREKPQPVALRFDMRFITVQQEFNAARSLGDMCRNLKCLTLTRQTSSTGEYLSTSRILRAFAEKAPNLTCLAIYESIDYVSIYSFPDGFGKLAHARGYLAVVGGGEQAHIAHHKGALCEAAGLRLGAAELPHEPGQGRVLVLVLLGLLDRLVHGEGGLLFRQDGALCARDVRRRADTLHVHLVPQGPVPRLAAGAGAARSGRATAAEAHVAVDPAERGHVSRGRPGSPHGAVCDKRVARSSACGAPHHQCLQRAHLATCQSQC